MPGERPFGVEAALNVLREGCARITTVRSEGGTPQIPRQVHTVVATLDAAAARVGGVARNGNQGAKHEEPSVIPDARGAFPRPGSRIGCAGAGRRSRLRCRALGRIRTALP